MNRLFALSRVVASRYVVLWFLVLVSLALPRRSSGQCTMEWLDGMELAGADRTVYASTVWDPPGPVGAQLVIAGELSIVGKLNAASIASLDLVTGEWRTLGTGIAGTVYCLAVSPAGDLLVGGSFGFAGDLPISGIARWNGTTWSPLGQGTNGSVLSMAFLPNGNLVAVGSFTLAGGQAANCVAQWNGTAWSPLGTGTLSTVRAVTALPNGDIIVGGEFTNIGGVNANRVARWNGSTWSAMGAGFSNVVRALIVRPNGDLVAAGDSGSPTSRVARWTGTSWSPVGSNVSLVFQVHSLINFPNGDLGFGGYDIDSGEDATVARFNGATWQLIGSAMRGIVHSLTVMPDGALLATGSMRTTDTSGIGRLAVLNGQSWGPLIVGMGLDADVFDVSPSTNDGILAAGIFDAAGISNANTIARWDPSGWHAIGPWTDPDSSARVVVGMPDGTTVAGGGPIWGAGSGGSALVRSDGTSWNSYGNDLSFWVNAVATLPNGQLVAGGSFQHLGLDLAYLVRWTGTTWASLGTGVNGAVGNMATLSNGHLIVTGSFSMAGGMPANRIARWNGTAWSPVGSGLESSASAIVALTNGQFAVSGNFSVDSQPVAPRVITWDGGAWRAVGGEFDGPISDIAVTPSGELIAVGDFSNAGDAPANRVARWDGVAWRALGSGINGPATCVAVRPNGEIFVGGNFTMAGNKPSFNIARYGQVCYCPADLTGVASTRDGAVNIDDLLFFLFTFEASDLRADLDNDGDPASGTPDNAVDINDLLFFLARFEAGC